MPKATRVEMPNVGSPGQDLPTHLVPRFNPIAETSAVVVNGNARFTVLADRLIRMEYDPEARFEDRPSLAFWFRRQPAPRFSVKVTGDGADIITERLHLTWRNSPAGFAADTLQVTLTDGGKVWRFGDSDPENLRGTCRTLDARDGAIPLPPGLMSRSGWSVIDDSAVPVFNASGWVEPRQTADARRDLYFFGYGSDYAACLRDFCAVSGTIPLPPRFVFGNWWSRYHAYDEAELLELVAGFKRHDIPLSVCVIDMDWHTVKNPHHPGWTGFSWNKDLFPDPARLLKALRAEGLKVAPNLHPHEGAHPHEDAYPAMARHMGMDPSTGAAVRFHPTNPRFMTGYFAHLLNPHEDMGVDFWWMDWQQGDTTDVKGLDPLWWLNHLHFLDLGRDGHKRPLAFSRWAGWGSQRYPIAFSGDTYVTWRSLAFQPYFTATAANAGCCYWSHDIGGHIMGAEDPELYLRWIQFGVCSPILRIHATNNRFQDRRLWTHGPEVLSIGREYLQLRRRLVPYLYSAAYVTHRHCIPMARPLYWDYPAEKEAYACGWEYCLGKDLIAAPVSRPRDPDTGRARQPVWLPGGGWYNFFSGEYLEGGRVLTRGYRIEELPLFARAGAIVPLEAGARWGAIDNAVEMEVRVFAGDRGEFELYEDDGETTAYRSDGGCTTAMRQEMRDGSLTFTIDAAQGNCRALPASRSWNVLFHGVAPDVKVDCRTGGRPSVVRTTYDAERECLTVTTGPAPVTVSVALTLTSAGSTLLARRDRSAEYLELMIRDFRMGNESKVLVFDLATSGAADASALVGIAAHATRSQMRVLCETVLEAGYEFIDTQGADRQQLILWNNRLAPEITYHLHRQGGAGRQQAVPRFVHEPLDDLMWGMHLPTGRDWHLAFGYGQGVILGDGGTVKGGV